MRIAITGASGGIGSALVEELKGRGDEVTVLSRSPERASEKLGVEAVAWDPSAEPAPAEALAGRDGVVHLAGERVDQRWSEEAKHAIRESRTVGTRNLVAGLGAVDPRPGVLVSASAVGYYGPRGDEEIDESQPPGEGFLARVVVDWEAAAREAEGLGVRVVNPRTGIVLSPDAGALSRMLPFFRMGVGGPVAGGRQWMPWVHRDDVLGMMLAALEDPAWSGAVNVAAPVPVTNRDFSAALGRALHRPAVLPVPGFALRLLYGEMADIVTSGQRAIPKRPLELGYRFRHPELDEALRSALA
jgi:uncharacterized protein (TIGR01777 family)